LFSLVAAALEPKAIAGVELSGSFGSLKEIIESNGSVDQAPELYCFGLLEQFDVKQLAAIVAPRPVAFRQPGERAKQELGALKSWYALLGAEFDPLAAHVAPVRLESLTYGTIFRARLAEQVSMFVGGSRACLRRRGADEGMAPGRGHWSPNHGW
jgi:hypothetical protein